MGKKKLKAKNEALLAHVEVLEIQNKELERGKQFNHQRFVQDTVKGIGMDITFNEGDLIIADTSKRNYASGDIFMMDLLKGAGTNVARLQACPDGVEIMHENIYHRRNVVSRERAEELIIGRIVGHISKEVLA